MFGLGITWVTVVVAAPVAVAALYTVGLFAAGAARGVRTYLNDPRRPRPPLGWPPWTRPTAGRRMRYVIARRLWRGRVRLAALLAAAGLKARY